MLIIDFLFLLSILKQHPFWPFWTVSARQGQCPGPVFSYNNRTKKPVPVLAIPGYLIEFPGSLHPLDCQVYRNCIADVWCAETLQVLCDLQKQYRYCLLYTPCTGNVLCTESIVVLSYIQKCTGTFWCTETVQVLMELQKLYRHSLMDRNCTDTVPCTETVKVEVVPEKISD